jgi:hypothetical protein
MIRHPHDEEGCPKAISAVNPTGAEEARDAQMV